MTKIRKKGYGMLLMVTIIITIGAISTVVPSSVASKECLLGYKAHCSFTPISTLICVVLAGAVCSFRRRKYTEEQ